MLKLTQGFGTQIDPGEPGFIQLSRGDTLLLVEQLEQWLWGSEEEET